MKQEKKALTLKTINKSNIWGIQENDIFRMWEAAEKDSDLRDNARHYLDVIKSAFEVEELKTDKPEIIKKYEERGFKVALVRIDDNAKNSLAVKKRTIQRVNDLTYENIHYISATTLIEILERNFGGGWDSLSQNIKDIIESGFDISTTVLPKDRLHKKGGMYDKKVADGFEVLEIQKGTWLEAIFVKEKLEVQEIISRKEESNSLANIFSDDDDDHQSERDDDDVSMIGEENDDDTYDNDEMMEESYRTTFEAENDELNMEAERVGDDDDDSY
ncbi:hypothetical protein [Hoylesella saccharolytica]|uniref:hypothetical protein n=1 Tax=Hoylesella saccharolytica TaxID=633701 RepID=UPI0028E86B60|nr:hypothetical protein [Hoylesella saccharolytica]